MDKNISLYFSLSDIKKIYNKSLIFIQVVLESLIDKPLYLLILQWTCKMGHSTHSRLKSTWLWIGFQPMTIKWHQRCTPPLNHHLCWPSVLGTARTPETQAEPQLKIEGAQGSGPITTKRLSANRIFNWDWVLWTKQKYSTWRARSEVIEVEVIIRE